MSVIIKEVSPRYYAGELIRLQYTTLPYDDPLIPTEKGRWWGVFDTGTLVGYGSMMDARYWREASYLSRAGVLKSHRGQGIHRRLIKIRIRVSQKLKKECIISDCTPDNIHSANSLILCGFTLYRPNTPWALPNSLYWRKKL